MKLSPIVMPAQAGIWLDKERSYAAQFIVSPLFKRTMCTTEMTVSERFRS